MGVAATLPELSEWTLTPLGCNVFKKPFRSTNSYYILPFIACPLAFI